MREGRTAGKARHMARTSPRVPCVRRTGAGTCWAGADGGAVITSSPSSPGPGAPSAGAWAGTLSENGRAMYAQ